MKVSRKLEVLTSLDHFHRLFYRGVTTLGRLNILITDFGFFGRSVTVSIVALEERCGSGPPV